MNEQIMKLAIPISLIVLLGIAMLWALRWSRKKSAAFKASSAARICDNELKNKPILEQLRSKETWEKVVDFFHGHDPNTDKGKAIRYDMFGYFGWLPLLISSLIMAATLAVFSLIFW